MSHPFSVVRPVQPSLEAHNAAYRRALTAKWVQEFIDENYVEPGRFGRLAAELGLAEATLGRWFRDTFGMSMTGYLGQVRMDHARRLLRDTDWSVATVAHHVGYGTHRTFGAVFRRMVGVTPSGYRARLRKEEADAVSDA